MLHEFVRNRKKKRWTVLCTDDFIPLWYKTSFRVKATFNPILFLTLASTLTLFLVSALDHKGYACGVNAHLWISDTAICRLPDGSHLKEIFQSQKRVDLTRLGSSFPDSGYAINHRYGEVAHWSPFIESYIQAFRRRYPSFEQWDESALDEATFILGVASHGFEDELFDSLFLRQVEENDQQGQDRLDPALDFFLIYDQHTELFPSFEFPAEIATEGLNDLGIDVSQEDLVTGVRRLHAFALSLSQSPQTLEGFVERDRPLLPWTHQFYLDEGVVGSLVHEAFWVSEQFEATWDRLKGVFNPDQVWIGTTPRPDEWLSFEAVQNQRSNGWITLYFSVGVDEQSAFEVIRLKDADGNEIPFDLRANRWSSGQGYSRLFQIRPRIYLDDHPLLSNHPENEPYQLSVEIQSPLVLVSNESTTELQRSIVWMECKTPPCTPSMQELVAPPIVRSLTRGGQQQGCWVEGEDFHQDEGISVEDFSSIETILDQETDLNHVNLDLGVGDSNLHENDEDLTQKDAQVISNPDAVSSASEMNASARSTHSAGCQLPANINHHLPFPLVFFFLFLNRWKWMFPHRGTC